MRGTTGELEIGCIMRSSRVKAGVLPAGFLNFEFLFSWGFCARTCFLIRTSLGIKSSVAGAGMGKEKNLVNNVRGQSNE